MGPQQSGLPAQQGWRRAQQRGGEHGADASPAVAHSGSTLAAATLPISISPSLPSSLLSAASPAALRAARSAVHELQRWRRCAVPASCGSSLHTSSPQHSLLSEAAGDARLCTTSGVLAASGLLLLLLLALRPSTRRRRRAAQCIIACTKASSAAVRTMPPKKQAVARRYAASAASKRWGGLHRPCCVHRNACRGFHQRRISELQAGGMAAACSARRPQWQPPLQTNPPPNLSSRSPRTTRCSFS